MLYRDSRQEDHSIAATWVYTFSFIGGNSMTIITFRGRHKNVFVRMRYSQRSLCVDGCRYSQIRHRFTRDQAAAVIQINLVVQPRMIVDIVAATETAAGLFRRDEEEDFLHPGVDQSHGAHHAWLMSDEDRQGCEEVCGAVSSCQYIAEGGQRPKSSDVFHAIHRGVAKGAPFRSAGVDAARPDVGCGRDGVWVGYDGLYGWARCQHCDRHFASSFVRPSLFHDPLDS